MHSLRKHRASTATATCNHASEPLSWDGCDGSGGRQVLPGGLKTREGQNRALGLELAGGCDEAVLDL